MFKTVVAASVAAFIVVGVGQSARASLENADKLYQAGELTAALEEYVATGGEGNVRAAQMFERGEGTPEPRLEKAAAWYQVAARAGHMAALTSLAEMFAEGRGVAEDKVQAWALLDIAARKGHADAATKRDKLAEEMTENQVEAGPRRAEKLAPKYIN